MNKKDYLGKATEKIYNSGAKKIVSTELESHIDERINFYKEIGYDDQASEEKAACAMGDTDTVAVQFGELHNDFYNPAADIIFLLIWFGLLGGVFYLLKQYVFYDVGLYALILGASCFSFAIMFAYSALSLFRNKIVPVILSLLGIGATGVFNYFILIELDKKMSDSLPNLINFIFKTDIPGATNYPSEEKVILAVLLVSLASIVTFIFSFIYNIKVKCLANKKFDNRIRHVIIGVTSGFSLTSIVLCVLFSVKCSADLNTIKSEYYDAYDYVLELSEKCDTKEEIIDFIEKSNYDFTENRDKDDHLTGYLYTKNLVSIDIGFQSTKSKKEIRKDYQEELDSMDDEMEELYEKIGQFELLQSAENKAGKEFLEEGIDKRVEMDYYDQEFCNIRLSPRIYYFDNSYDRPSTSFLEVKEDRENKFYQYETSKLNNIKKYDFYKEIKPTGIKITYKLSETENCSYEFEYVFGEGSFKRTEGYRAIKGNEKNTELYNQIDKVTKIINTDRNMSSSKIAKRTGAAVEQPEMTREEYQESLSILGSYFDNVKETLLDSYDMSTKYVFDDWYFMLSGKPFKSISIYDRNDKLIAVKSLGDTLERVNFDGADGQKKVRIDYGYFDKKGYFYSSSDYMPYYTADGKKYYYYCKTIEDKTHTVGNTKEYYLTDRNNLFYEADICFINKNGYLYIDTSKSLKYDEKTKKFKSQNGNEYTKAFETSWDENGNLIFQSDEY